MYKYPPIHSLGLSHNLSYLCTSCHLSSPMYVTQSFLPHACHAIFLFHVCHTIFLPHLCQAFFLPLCMSHNLSSLIYVTQFSSPLYATQSFLFHMWRTDFYDKLKRGYNLTCIWDALGWWGWGWNIHWWIFYVCLLFTRMHLSGEVCVLNKKVTSKCGTVDLDYIMVCLTSSVMQCCNS